MKIVLLAIFSRAISIAETRAMTTVLTTLSEEGGCTTRRV